MVYVKIFHTCAASQVLGLQTRAITHTVYDYLKDHSCKTESPKKEWILESATGYLSMGSDNSENPVKTPCLQGAYTLLFGQPVFIQ